MNYIIILLIFFLINYICFFYYDTKKRFIKSTEENNITIVDKLNINPDWETLLNNTNNEFLCTTEDVAIEFLKIAHNYGYTWRNFRFYNQDTFWNHYKEQTCYSLFYNNIHYGTHEPNTNLIDVKELIEGYRKPFKLHR